MGSFRRLNESELMRLSDEELVDYIAVAREAGDRGAEKEAVGHLAFGFQDQIEAWVRKDMGSAPREDIEDVVMEALQSAIKGTFEGKIVGAFGAWLKTITARRVADYYRQRGRRIKGDPLPGENRGDETVWGEEPYDDDFTLEAGTRDAIERLLATRPEEQREVIRLYGPGVAGFENLPADEVAAQIDGMSPANVHQIWSRFRRDLREALDG